MRVDPTSNLGLNAESIGHYQVGEISRTNMSRKPELLPYGYLVGDATDIMISLKKADANIDIAQVNCQKKKRKNMNSEQYSRSKFY